MRVHAAAATGDTEQVQNVTAQVQDGYRRLTGRIGFKECGGGV
jgi:hypothetical protein